MSDEGINKLFAALVVNKGLCTRFLRSEERLSILKEGYQGETFNLSDDEIARILLANGNSLKEMTTNFIEHPYRISTERG